MLSCELYWGNNFFIDNKKLITIKVFIYNYLPPEKENIKKSQVKRPQNFLCYAEKGNKMFTS